MRRATARNNNVVTGKEEYFYNNEGQRIGIVSRSGNGTITAARVFIGDTELKLTPAGALTTSYANISLGTPVARITNRSGLELQYHGLADNTLLSVAADGTVNSGFVYAPYGELLHAIGSTQTQAEQHRRFNDKYRDDVTKLGYYGARYYDGLLLGWTQADPLYRFKPDAAWADPRKALLYTFSQSNPVRYLDPDGRQSRSVNVHFVYTTNADYRPGAQDAMEAAVLDILKPTTDVPLTRSRDTTSGVTRAALTGHNSAREIIVMVANQNDTAEFRGIISDATGLRGGRLTNATTAATEQITEAGASDTVMGVTLFDGRRRVRNQDRDIVFVSANGVDLNSNAAGTDNTALVVGHEVASHVANNPHTDTGLTAHEPTDASVTPGQARRIDAEMERRADR